VHPKDRHAGPLPDRDAGVCRPSIVRVDIQEVAIGVLKTEAVAVFVIDGVDKRHNGNLIFWAGRT
jgi:hypothetical protein